MTNSKGELVNTGIGIRWGRKITQEIEDAYKSHYLAAGWTDTSCDDYVAFTDPSGRWHHLHNRLDDRFISIDGHWMINLKVTKNEDTSTPSAVSLVQEDT